METKNPIKTCFLVSVFSYLTLLCRVTHQLRLPEWHTTAVMHKCVMKTPCFVSVVRESAKYLNIYVILLELVDLIYVSASLNQCT